MRTHIMGGARGMSGALPRGGPGVAAYLGRLLILACVLLGIAGDALAVYSPRTARFLQKDPNESGMLHAELRHDGTAPMPKLAAASMEGTTIDGSNLFAFVRNSPYNATDPQGLFLGIVGQALAFGFDSWLSAKGTLEEARDGVILDLETADMLSGYAANQLDMVEWALDWNQSDDFGYPVDTTSDVGASSGHAVGARAHSPIATKKPRNYALRGKHHKYEYKGRRVPFNRKGYPIFDSFAIQDVNIKRQTGNRHKDDMMADAQVRRIEGPDWKRPKGYTWHHHEDGRRMQLVPTPLHKKVGHTGGVARVGPRRR